jgi:NDP-sugar pyrophosphorylase family protein
MLLSHDLFDSNMLSENLRELLRVGLPWEILAKLDAFVQTIPDDRQGYIHDTAVLEGNVFVHQTAKIAPHVFIEGPAYIGERVQVKHGAYLRGGVVLAAGAEVGAKTEVKRSLFLNQAKAAHLNYVGDSVLGNKVNLGAGVKLANFKTAGTTISIEGQATGLRKLGALIGDYSSLGCNAVTTPGTVIGKNVMVYNCAVLRGIVPANTIVKLKQGLEYIAKE